ncbi:MAG: lysophospholipid acyltransferase family protein [Bacteroidota bacterium]
MIGVFFFRLASRLPFSWLYAISDLLAFVIRPFYRRKVVISNLKSSFPDKTDAEIKSLLPGIYRNICDVLVETIKSHGITREQLGERVKFVNVAALNSHIESKTSIYLLAAHQCNWEWLLLAISSQLPIHADVVYKPLKDKAMDDFLLKNRERFGAHLIPKDDALMEILKRRDKLRGICIAADQLPVRTTNKFWTKFLNQDTAFYMGPEQLPKFTSLPVYFVNIWRTRRGYYNIEFIPIAKPPYAKGKIDILPKYAEEAEAMIKKNPTDWLWSHKRWKYPKPDKPDKANQYTEEV